MVLHHNGSIPQAELGLRSGGGESSPTPPHPTPGRIGDRVSVLEGSLTWVSLLFDFGKESYLDMTR